MDTKPQVLPPIKRFRLLQQQHQLEEEENKENNSPSPLHLPAKKRKQTRTALLPPPVPTKSVPATNYCLPAKKRVWALHPDFISGTPLSPFDLNVEYKPSFNIEENVKENDENPLPFCENQSIQPNENVKENDENPLPFCENQSIQPNQDEVVVGFKITKPQSIETPLPICDNQSVQTDQDEEVVGLVIENNITNQEVEEEIEDGVDNDDDGILCAVCQSTDGDPTDPIVFCDGCDLMVHATCYGNPLIKGVPEGDWFCSQCLVSQSGKQDEPFSCCLCTTKGGALKPTKDDGVWAHLVCALLVPEVFFEDPDGREGVDCSKVPKRRWEQKCYLCKSRKGCVIECSEPNCPLAFHVTCGLNEDLCIEYKEGQKNRETIVAGFCKKHTEIWQKQQETGKFKIVADKSMRIR